METVYLSIELCYGIGGSRRTMRDRVPFLGTLYDKRGTSSSHAKVEGVPFRAMVRQRGYLSEPCYGTGGTFSSYGAEEVSFRATLR